MAIKGITTTEYEDDGNTINYGTKTNRTRISVVGLSQSDIKQEYDFEKQMLERSENSLPKMRDDAKKIQNLMTASLKEKKEALDQVQRTEKNIEIVKKIVLPFYEKHLFRKISPEDELRAMINDLLTDACADNLSSICRMASTPAGKETIANMIFQYCANNGCSPQTAMAFLESELPPQ